VFGKQLDFPKAAPVVCLIYAAPMFVGFKVIGVADATMNGRPSYPGSQVSVNMSANKRQRTANCPNRHLVSWRPLRTMKSLLTTP